MKHTLALVLMVFGIVGCGDMRTNFKDKELFYENNIGKNINEDIVIEGMRNSFENYLPEDILFKIDRCSMLNSIEARTPYLDKKLVDYIFKNSNGKDHVSFLTYLPSTTSIVHLQ